jgi:hypothetical protein
MAMAVGVPTGALDLGDFGGELINGVLSLIGDVGRVDRAITDRVEDELAANLRGR